MSLVPRVLELLKTNQQGEVLVFVGGIIPAEDAVELKKKGIREVYGPGTRTTTIVEDIRTALEHTKV